MYLKMLEIQGFKSFPEKTVIEFHEGITAIVGPNGSGKSNVTDAIRWVLGEQSIKTLRGSRMQDVIFTGTQSRRAMGYAEVTMVIDNSDGKLDVDYSEVAVTRRLYRSGESEYSLNKTPCRLKDIVGLFMDTGIGRDGYSIVGQGRVDEILSNKSEDRRKVFEEASGIVKYKTRKEESERKLENTKQNLVRINDIISEIEDRLEPLEEQSVKANKYLNLRDELKSIEVALFLEKIERYTQKFDEYSQEYSDIQKQINEYNFRLEKLKSQNREYTDSIKSIDEELENFKESLETTTDGIKEFESQIKFNNERIDQLKTKINIINEEGVSFDGEIAKISEELSEKRKKEEYLNGQLEKYREEMSINESKMEEIIETLNESEKKAEELKQRLEELTESLYDKKNQAGQTRAQTEMIENRDKSLDSEITTLISEKDKLTLEKEECEDLLLEINKRYDEKCKKLEQMRSSLEKAKKDCDKTIADIENKKSGLANAQYRIKMLSELEESMAGYSEAVKSIMQKHSEDKTFFPGIKGTVADLIKVPERYETAIETALGSSIQNIVTENESIASELIDYLKKNRLGRATFLPVASIRGKRLDNKILTGLRKMEGFIGIASELVEMPRQMSNILDNLLGRIVVARNLEYAITLSGKLGYSFRTVTLDGEVVNPGGSLTGGYYRKKGPGLIGRTREIEELKKHVQKEEKEITKLNESLPEKKNILAEKAKELNDFEHGLNDDSHEKIREESRLASINQDISRSEGRIKMLQAEKDQLKNQSEKVDSEVKALEAEAVEIDKSIAEIKEEIEKTRVAGKEEERKRDELREHVSDLKLSVNSVEESLIAAKEITERIEKEKQSYLGNVKKSETEKQKASQDIERLESENERIKTNIDEKSEEKDELTAKNEELSEKKRELEGRMSEFYEKYEKNSETIGNLRTELAKCEVKKGRMESALDEVKNKLWEEYELTYDNAGKWKADSGEQVSQKKVNELKAEIKELGDININSIEEYKTTSERYEFLKKQRDDIELSKDKLINMIADITEEMKKRFMEHFKVINENFKIVFSELFGGGMAQIILGDENDVLNCNIDIHAQPPGKKLQNMLLLSGGERCLTAIALLFAILKLRPSPFCVLDEIEAALDDANIVRFSEYIRNYSDESQFILVTHRKGTMEAADMLYGVTMQERGISKILSMKMED